jgi:hypothetical protein
MMTIANIPMATRMSGLLPVESTMLPQNGSTTSAPKNDRADRCQDDIDVEVRVISKKFDCKDAKTPEHRGVKDIKDKELPKRRMREHGSPGHILRAQMHRFTGLNLRDSVNEPQTHGPAHRADEKYQCVVPLGHDTSGGDQGRGEQRQQAAEVHKKLVHQGMAATRNISTLRIPQPSKTNWR